MSKTVPDIGIFETKVIHVNTKTYIKMLNISTNLTIRLVEQVMWLKAWSELRRNVRDLVVDDAHATRERYQRASIEIRRMLAQGRVIAYRDFKHDGTGNEKLDICFITAWHQESYENIGRYMAFRIYYTHSNCDTNKIGFRKYKAAEVCCYYDGEDPDPGASFLSEEEAKAYTRKKEGYHVI